MFVRSCDPSVVEELSLLKFEILKVVHLPSVLCCFLSRDIYF